MSSSVPVTGVPVKGSWRDNNYWQNPDYNLVRRYNLNPPNTTQAVITFALSSVILALSAYSLAIEDTEKPYDKVYKGLLWAAVVLGGSIVILMILSFVMKQVFKPHSA